MTPNKTLYTDPCSLKVLLWELHMQLSLLQPIKILSLKVECACVRNNSKKKPGECNLSSTHVYSSNLHYQYPHWNDVTQRKNRKWNQESTVWITMLSKFTKFHKRLTLLIDKQVLQTALLSNSWKISHLRILVWRRSDKILWRNHAEVVQDLK